MDRYIRSSYIVINRSGDVGTNNPEISFNFQNRQIAAGYLTTVSGTGER